MYHFTALAAAATEAKPGLFEALGLDIRQLIVQTLAFLLLVALLRRFVYPALIKSIDARQAAMDTAAKEAAEARKSLDEAAQKVDSMLQSARDEANQIVSRSQSDAAAMVAEAEERARERAERQVEDARARLEADVTQARLELKREAAHLVAKATEAVLREKVDEGKDAKLIDRALKAERL